MSILGKLKQLAGNAVHDVQGAVAQVNPLDNGRTYQTVQQHGAQYAPQAPAPALTQAYRNPLVQSVVQAPVGFARAVANVPAMVAADVTNNPVAQQHITQRAFGTTDPGQVLKKIAANTVGTALTVATPELKGASLAAKSLAGAGIGAGMNAASALGNNEGIKDIAKSAGVGALLGGVLPGAAKVTSKVAPKVASVVGNKAVDVATNKPLRNISDAELGAANKVSMQRAGYGSDVANPTQADYVTYNKVQNKLGVDASNHQAVDDAIAARQTYNVQQAQRVQALKNLNAKVNNLAQQHGGLGLATKAVDENGNPVSGFTGKPIADGSTTVQTPRAPEAVTGASTSPQIPGTSSPKVTTNSLTRKVKLQNLSPEAQAQVQGEGLVRNTKQLADDAATKANSQSLDKNIQAAHQSLAVAPGQIDDATVAHVQQAIERADAAGRTQDAVALHDSLSEHLRKQGQTIQAASLLYRLSPQGLFYRGLNDLKRSGTEVTPELQAKLQGAVDALKAAPEGDAKDLARAQFHKLVADNLKQGKVQNLISVWKAGLLSGPLTQAGNFASNATFGGLKKISDIPATAIDKGISLITGNRTKTLTGTGIASGTNQGFKTAFGTLKTGIDVRNIEGSKYEIHGEINFKNPVIQAVFGKTSNMVFRGMSAADQPFYYAALKNNLADLAKANGINQGLKGSALAKHMAETMNNPTKDIAETAKLAAQTAVLGQDSKLASAISKFAQSHPALQAVVPFTKVPTNFLTRTLDFTPIGPVKTAVRQIRNKSFDQRALSEAIGEGATGTGLIYLGTELANHNLLSGQYPSNDPKEVQRWKAEGIQPNSVKLGKNWINLNYIGPVGILLQAGKDFHDGIVAGENGVVQSVTGLAKSLAGQSFLTGFSGAANAINDPGRYGANFVHSQAASIVPSWVNAVANASDSKQRQADTTLQTIQSRIPGARTGLPVKTDVYGNPLSQRTDPTNLLTNPLKPSADLSQKNSVVAEVSRLHNVDPNNSDLQVTPTQITSVKADKQNIKLNDTQKRDLQNQVGQQIQANWSKLIQTPQYQALDDTDKAKALNNSRSDTTTLAERQYVTANNLGSYSKAPSKKVIALGQGTANLADYTKTSKAGTSGTSIAPNLNKQYADTITKYDSMNTTDRSKAFASDNAAEFNYNYAKFQNAKANGTLSDVQTIKAQNALAKQQVGSNFSQQIRDLYGLNKADLKQYLGSASNGKDLYAQLQQYDNALYDSGNTTKKKFANGLNSGRVARTRSGARRARAKTTFQAPSSSFKTARIPKITSGKVRKVSLGNSSLHVSKIKAPKKVKVLA